MVPLEKWSIQSPLCLQKFPNQPFAASAASLAPCETPKAWSCSCKLSSPFTLGGNLDFHSRTLTPVAVLLSGALRSRGACLHPSTPWSPYKPGGSLEGEAVSPLSKPSPFKCLARKYLWNE